MEVLGMGLLLVVVCGLVNCLCLVVLKWIGVGDVKFYVLVGKGIIFDIGGVNLKIQGGIEEMKYDMCGGVNVIGIFVVVVKVKLLLNFVVVVLVVENVIDGNVYCLLDVIILMLGKIIEVGNIDVEGCLILCDVLIYVQCFELVVLVDVVILIGVCMVVFGYQIVGLMSKYDDLVNELLVVGEYVFDCVWCLLLWDEYQLMLDLIFVDVYNIGGCWVGVIIVGCFLLCFVEGQCWVYLDIVGVVSDEGKCGMVIGCLVGLLS